MVPPADDAFDRAAILRRRAAFLASALSTLSSSVLSTGTAEAQGEPAPPAAAANCPRDPEDAQAAAALTVEAKELIERGQHAQAAVLLEKVYRMVPAWPIARDRMLALAQSGDLEGAYLAGTQHLECVGESAEIRAELAALELRGGRLIVLVRPAYGSYAIEVDGRVYDPARMEKGVLVAAGKHVVVLQGSGMGARSEVEVAVGETQHIELAGAPPMPCLSPPRSYDKRELIRLGGGPVGPIVGIVPDDPVQVVGGGGARLAFTTTFNKELLFEGEVFGAALANDLHRFAVVGTSSEVRYRPLDVYSLGLGFSVGYLVSLEEEPGYLPSSVFFGPVLVPASFRAGPASIDIRIPCWFSSTEQEGVSALRVGLVAPQIAVTFSAVVKESEEQW